MPTLTPTSAGTKRQPTVAAQVRTQLRQMDAYLVRIADGSERVSKWTQLAVRRHLRDLERSRQDDFPFEFQRARLERVLRFCLCLKHVKGDITGQALVFHPWAVFFLGALFAWVRKDTGARRFRRVLCFVPRGNAKSTLLSAAALYATFGDDQQADAFSLATKREQAQIVWGDAAAMLRASPGLKEKLGVDVGAHAIVQLRTNSTFKPLASEAKSLDGLNVSFAVMDELHEVPRELAEVITTALGKRASSVMVAISTAGFDSSSYAHEQYNYLCSVLDGSTVDELTFGLIYEMPAGADWQAEETWKAANPMYGLSVRPEILAQSAAQAARLPGSKAAFLVKHLNVWQDSHSPWMPMDRWDACADPTLRREDFAGRSCIIGLDLATVHDLCAKVSVFTDLDAAGGRTYAVFCDTYLNENAVRTGNPAFGAWAERGFIQAAGADTTDFEPIKAALLQDRERFVVESVCYDPYLAPRFAQEMEAEGLMMVETRQTVPVLSPAMKEVEAAVYSRRLRHDGNPVLRFCMGNVVARIDANDNVFPRKENASRYIDAGTALFNAATRAAVVGPRAQAGTGLSLVETADSSSEAARHEAFWGDEE